MILLTLLFLALLTFFASANPTTTTTTLALHPRQEPNLYCINTCFGLDRARALEAIEWFCHENEGAHLAYYDNFDTGALRTLAVSQNYSYWPPASYAYPFYEEGLVWMSMGYWLGHLDACAEPLTGYDVRFDDCRAGLVGVVDSCNTDHEDWKQGGSLHDTCFVWNLDPNPRKPCRLDEREEGADPVGE